MYMHFVSLSLISEIVNSQDAAPQYPLRKSYLHANSVVNYSVLCIEARVRTGFYLLPAADDRSRSEWQDNNIVASVAFVFSAAFRESMTDS